MFKTSFILLFYYDKLQLNIQYLLKIINFNMYYINRVYVDILYFTHKLKVINCD